MLSVQTFASDVTVIEPGSTSELRRPGRIKVHFVTSLFGTNVNILAILPCMSQQYNSSHRHLSDPRSTLFCLD